MMGDELSFLILVAKHWEKGFSVLTNTQKNFSESYHIFKVANVIEQ